MITDVLNTIKTTLQADPALSSVTNYHLVDGMVPGTNPTISIGCAKLDYHEYSREQDEVKAKLHLYVYTQSINPEKGEETIRSLTYAVRYTLLADPYLGGQVDMSTISSITFESDQVHQGMLIHYAFLEYDVVYYESRQRPATGLPTVSELDITANSETLDITL